MTANAIASPALKRCPPTARPGASASFRSARGPTASEAGGDPERPNARPRRLGRGCGSSAAGGELGLGLSPT